MQRTVRLSVEALEDRYLLSAPALIPPPPVPALVAEASPSLVLSLKTDHVNYRVGELVKLIVIETNVGNQDAPISTGCGYYAEYWLSRDGVEYSTQTGPRPLCATYFSVLQPGESRTLGSTWFNHERLLGKFEVHAKVDGVLADPVRIHIKPPIAIAVKLKTDHGSYRLGQQVEITLREKNTSDRDVGVGDGYGPFSVSIRNQEGQIVRQFGERDVKGCSPFLGCFYFSGALKPHESRIFKVVWDGRSDLGGQVAPGLYTVVGNLDRLSAFATIRIRGR